KITLYDILGRKVKTVLDEKKPAGQYELRFDAGHLSSGIYFYRLSAGDQALTRKFILLR
ncbi:MAG: T9SS type A sorting domain-containing protein, partial [Aliifodinibius sp.]|nr:T9SS type A sorting domain-containing protein [candidate division Zixibacteria bacterium]NIT59632.1 T9SS type A sorting domain-containing protein [Fodinibius sp.]NIS47621.1 T9SS type A sorting domain-containing protein [candidate division Zixibacteria bacterium]NIU17354.1 T9SS type A sorting domain-containing protein [candidate division Zixibacteria bacterium]NIV07869.1 T9SS type A sorting domain-containing protein [candidate division Zixibacteria bacterium]